MYGDHSRENILFMYMHLAIEQFTTQSSFNDTMITIKTLLSRLKKKGCGLREEQFKTEKKKLNDKVFH